MAGTAVTVHGEGFTAFGSEANRVRCRWGQADADQTPALLLEPTKLVCKAHSKSSAGPHELFVALNAVDFGSTGLQYKYYAQLAALELAPNGGPLHGGTPVTFSGNGLDALYGALDDTLCRWGAGADAPTSTPSLLEPERLVCASAPRSTAAANGSFSEDVAVAVALNRVDYATLPGLSFRYYTAPIFS